MEIAASGTSLGPTGSENTSDRVRTSTESLTVLKLGLLRPSHSQHQAVGFLINGLDRWDNEGLPINIPCIKSNTAESLAVADGSGARVESCSGGFTLLEIAIGQVLPTLRSNMEGKD